MISVIKAETNLKKKADLLKEYVRGDVNLDELSRFLRDEVDQTEFKSWREFCRQIQKYVAQQFYKKNRKSLMHSSAIKLAGLIPIRVGNDDTRKSNPILGFHLLDDKTKLDWLDRAEKHLEVLRKLLLSHPEMILLERNPAIFRRLQGIVEDSGVASDWEDRIQERLNAESTENIISEDFDENLQLTHMQQSQVVFRWTRLALLASLAGVFYFSFFPGAELMYDRLVLTWETYLSNSQRAGAQSVNTSSGIISPPVTKLNALSMVKETPQNAVVDLKIPISSVAVSAKAKVESKPINKIRPTEAAIKPSIKTQTLSGDKSLQVSESVSTSKKSSTTKRINKLELDATKPAKITKLPIEKATSVEVTDHTSSVVPTVDGIVKNSEQSKTEIEAETETSAAKKLAAEKSVEEIVVTTSLPIDPTEFLIEGPVNLDIKEASELKDLAIKGPVKINLSDKHLMASIAVKESVLASEWSTTGILLLGKENGDRADTIIYAMVHHNPLSLRFLSIPRDLMVPIKHNSTLVKDKISHALRWSGVDGIRDSIQKFLGLKIDHYITIDLNLFRELVDVVGGVKIQIDRDLRYVDRAGGVDINLKKGEHLLSGKDAEGYVRFRTDGYGDLGRIKRQQKFLAAFLKRLRGMNELSWQNIHLLSGLPKFLTEVVKKSSTDLTVMSVAQLLKSFVADPSVDVSFMRLGGHAEYIENQQLKKKLSYFLSDSEHIRDAVYWMTVKESFRNPKLALAN